MAVNNFGILEPERADLDYQCGLSKVIRRLHWTAVSQARRSGHMIWLKQNWCKDPITQIDDGINERNTLCDVTRGVRQRCVLSPALFPAALDMAPVHGVARSELDSTWAMECWWCFDFCYNMSKYIEADLFWINLSCLFGKLHPYGTQTQPR